MKKLLLASIAALSLSAAPVLAQDNADAETAVGATTGGVGGAIIGGLIFGPLGAVVGGFTGATIGAAAVDEASLEYARLNPGEPVETIGDIEEGTEIPEEIELSLIEGNDEVGYFYTQDRLFFVDLETRAVVYSPGVVVAAEAD